MGRGSSIGPELAVIGLAERAPAKINLTLRVAGRRPDGFHEIDSLVVFAPALGDDIVLDANCEPGVTTDGPFAEAIVGPNLLRVSLDVLRTEYPALKLGHVRLTKNLPVAAGLGGGSADAAALLRAVRRLNPEMADDVDWFALAVRLGADVPVCLAASPSRMRGIGERLSPVGRLPRLPVVLANARAATSTDKTSRVFRALAAPPLRDGIEAVDEPLDFANREHLLDYMATHGNDLETAARSIMPEIDSVKAALANAQGCVAAALTGAGPTCFGIFRTKADAHAAAASLGDSHPRWWMCPAEIGG